MAFTLRPAVGENFLDREEIIKEMIETLSNFNIDMGFALIGPRRVGKTSILCECARLLEQNPHIVPVFFSFWELVEKTGREFAYLFSKRVIESYKSILCKKYKLTHALNVSFNTLISIFKNTNLSLKLFDELEITLRQRESRVEYISELLEDTFALPEQFASKTKTRCILILDEFPSIMDLKNGAKLGEGVIKKIRTINEGYKNTILCISGSIRSSMNTTVLSSIAPFYRQFIVKNIKPFRKEDIHNLLKRNLSANIEPDALSYLFEETSGVPLYAQFVGKRLMERREPTINLNLMKDALNKFFEEEGNIVFGEEFENLSAKEKLIIITIAQKDVHHLAEITKELGEEMNVVGRYLEYLLNKGTITKEKRGIYFITDPVFRKWLCLKEIFWG